MTSRACLPPHPNPLPQGEREGKIEQNLVALSLRMEGEKRARAFIFSLSPGGRGLG